MLTCFDVLASPGQLVSALSLPLRLSPSGEVGEGSDMVMTARRQRDQHPDPQGGLNPKSRCTRSSRAECTDWERSTGAAGWPPFLSLATTTSQVGESTRKAMVRCRDDEDVFVSIHVSRAREHRAEVKMKRMLQTYTPCVSRNY